MVHKSVVILLSAACSFTFASPYPARPTAAPNARLSRSSYQPISQALRSRITTPARYHKRGEDSPGGGVGYYHSESTSGTLREGIQLHLPSSFGSSDKDWAIRSAATDFLHAQLNLPAGSMESTHTGSAELHTHVYFKQMIDGIPVINAVANVAITKKNKVVAYGSNFAEPSSTTPSTPAITANDALGFAEAHFAATRVSELTPYISYYIDESHTAVLVWVTRVETPGGLHSYQAYVDARDGTVVGVVDYIVNFAYRVLPIQKQYPTDGFQVVSDPQNPVASPKGWHSDTSDAGIRTFGNNALSYKNDNQTTQGPSGPGGQFMFNWDPSNDPTATNNLALSKVNAFYLVNVVHDFTYIYGFTETLFNYQVDNFGKGGKGGDPVRISVQDAGDEGGHFDNANFMPTPDGEPGRMRMYLWDRTPLMRDGALENDIVVHEMGHGVSNRLVGGGTANCLQSDLSRGLGEGWSDTLAFWTERTDTSITDYKMGEYVQNGKNIRIAPYSTDMNANPLTYKNSAVLVDVHDIGVVWANMLINVYWELVKANGFSSTAFKDASGTAGNVVFMHLFIDAFSLMQCEPDFLNARDAMIQADFDRYNGDHSCLMWKVFASRGLGLKAGPGGAEDKTIPDGAKCELGRPLPGTETGKPTTTSKGATTTQAPTTTTTKLPPTETRNPDGCLVWWPFCMDA